MKKILLALLFLSVAYQSYAWKPIMAGHRGGGTGVENTAECFRNGVDVYGYNGLECDVRVTLDGKYVISHDETTNRLGGNLTVASATLADLKAETYAQTRNGVNYTGTICTMEEYLDICKEKNVFPLIELKYATGINTSSMTNFPGLLKLIEDKGLRDKVVFLTSMQYSLEYIRTNYPDIKCQYLISTPTDERFNWCVKWNVNPSYQAGVFDQSLLVKLHKAGLSAAVWTVDNETNYLKYSNMGVYMVTSNTLKTNTLPEIADIDWDSFPEDLNPIELETRLLWSRTSTGPNGLPTNFPASNGTTYKTGQQAAIIDGTFYVNDYGTSTLLVFDKNSTECALLPKTDGIMGGTATHGITCDDAGNIIQRNETGISSTPNSLLIYKKGEKTGKAISFSLVNPGQTNFITASGDIFSAEGGYIYLYPNSQKEVYIINIANGELVSTNAISNLSTAGSTAGYVIPIDNDPTNFIYQVRNVGYYRYEETNKGDYLTGSSSTSAPGRNSSIGGAYLTMENHQIFIHTSGTNYNGGLTIKDMSASGTPSLATFPPIGTGGYTANASCGTFMKLEKINDECYNLYTYTMGNGYAAYEIAKKGSSVNGTISANKTASLNMYPNPVIDETTINYSEPINNIEIYSITGNKVFDLNGNGNQTQTINIGGIMSGTYIIRINNTQTTKFVKL